ncbi:metal-dependent hydrolase [Natrinema gelatinilyticum]|uniref:metal-dependent hydrolase n=1 Tax=Natrinema gelatinilyticum TaxID=2961571 RepID=UPI0020C2CE01|nr:metal-dependent hydrolase [Natrinema gelatinilyticum]
MVADGVHILISLALVMIIFRSRQHEPYLVTALAAVVPDIDVIVFRPLATLGYAEGVLWAHRGLTHSLLAGVVVIGFLSMFGPWRAAAIGYGSHLVFDSLTGGVRLFAPFDPTLYGVSVDWLLLNLVTSAFAVTVLLGGMFATKYDFEYGASSFAPKPVFDWFQ